MGGDGAGGFALVLGEFADEGEDFGDVGGDCGTNLEVGHGVRDYFRGWLEGALGLTASHLSKGMVKEKSSCLPSRVWTILT